MVGVDLTIRFTGRMDIPILLHIAAQMSRYELCGIEQQRLLTCRLEGPCPPDELVEHVGGVLPEIWQIRDLLPGFPDSHEVSSLDVDTGSDRRHLQLDGHEPELLHSAGGADAAVADCRHG